jgi:acetyltransferase
MSTYRLKNLLSPRSIALVGASPRQGSVGRAILVNVGKAKFKGEFGLVNPRYAEIDGVKAVDNLSKLAFAPELVVITAPAKAVPGLIDEAGHCGAAGVIIVSARLGHGAGSLTEAALFARGATVVLKIMSRDIVHKSDVGGVVLNLTSAHAVRKATSDILARAKALRPAARISGVVVQEMVLRAKARELILGLADDPTFGTVVVFGRGGTAVEIINDKALALPPLDLQLARALIERTRVSRLLRAYRDVPAVKEDAVAMVLVKLAQLAADIPEIRGLDINPLLADEAGVLAVDARVVIGQVGRKFAGSGPANFAVRPYPSQWQRHIEVRDGWRVFVRPIRPEDEPLIHDLLRHMTPHDLRLRFFAPMKQFSHEFIARLTQLDYARAMAFVAFDEASNEMVGVVRIHSDSIYETGEYAILLRSDLKGRGLGWALMQLIIEYAKSEGLKVISGDVLAENTAMLAMCRSLGFEVKSDPVEHDICDVRLKL